MTRLLCALIAVSTLSLAPPASAKSIAVHKDSQGWTRVGPRTPPPANAYSASRNPKRPLLLCRVRHQGADLAGTVAGKACVVAFQGRQFASRAFDVLVPPRGARLTWSRPASGTLAPGTIVVGARPGRRMYVCRAQHAGGMYPGRLVGGRCQIGVDGKERSRATYEVLFHRRAGTVWVSNERRKSLEGAVLGGHERGHDVLACRGRGDARRLIGWVNRAGACVVASKGRATRLDDYHVLRRAYRWRAGRKGLPANAVAAGREAARTLYVCRGAYRNGMHPGKVVDGRCNIGWGGREVLLSKFQVLAAPKGSLAWVRAGNGAVPRRALRGGGEQGRELYVCRAEHLGGRHPGKVVSGGCNIGYGGRELVKRSYDVLVIN